MCVGFRYFVVRPIRTSSLIGVFVSAARIATQVHDTVVKIIHPQRFLLAIIVNRDTHHTFIYTCDYPTVISTSLLKGPEDSTCQEAFYPV